MYDGSLPGVEVMERPGQSSHHYTHVLRRQTLARPLEQPGQVSSATQLHQQQELLVHLLPHRVNYLLKPLQFEAEALDLLLVTLNITHNN